jgi:hypothetical protein
MSTQGKSQYPTQPALLTALGWLLSLAIGCSAAEQQKQKHPIDLRTATPHSEAPQTKACCDVKAPDVAPPKTVTLAPAVPAAPAQPVTQEHLLDKVTPLSDTAAIQFFGDNCASCHDAKAGSARSFWAMDKDQFSKQSLTVDALAPTVFATLLFKAKDIVGSKPTAMPMGETPAAVKAQLLPLIKWMSIEMPLASQDAQHFFNGTDLAAELGVGVILNFKCSKPASLREYLRRLTNDAFSREPTPAELKLGTSSLDSPLSDADRVTLGSRLLSDPSWKAEFEAKTLHKFAAKIAGSNDIQPLDKVISANQAQDLKDEFYQLLLTSYDKVSFSDLLLGSQVMVTANTAGLYGCPVPTAGWQACTMSPPRGSLFTTFGYLRSKPSSFLASNNNYGRAALMHFVVRGDVLSPGFDLDGGSGKVAPLPGCLKTKDYRGQNGTAIAWRGSASVPLAANLCQSCHIDRQMAAGSILFRPFNTAGQIYGVDAKIDATDPDFSTATGADMVVQPGLSGPTSPVTAAFLQSLITSDGTEQACVNAANAGGKDLPLKTVKDLATFIIGDGRTVAGGIARHLPRALSNLPTTTEEVIVKINQAFTDGKGLLAPMITAYFSSETYACTR